ncbi:MAG: hypothetical protein JO166_20635 [Deltaproteobacteria bacterium]|nr:hypothetical protein [Deltaproteobacteria bacterium]
MSIRGTISWLLGIVILMSLSVSSGARAQEAGSSTATTQSQVAQPPDGTVNWKGVGLGAGAVAGNLVYVPAKVAYGILGGIGGAAGYALTGGNKQVANSIWRSSLGGDYVLTPDMMTGKRPIYFSGPSDAGSSPAASTGSSPLSNNPPNEPAASFSRPSSALDTASPTSSASPPATHPIDSGAGLVGRGGTRSVPYGGSNTPDYSYSGQNRPPTGTKSRLPDTSIE